MPAISSVRTLCFFGSKPKSFSIVAFICFICLSVPYEHVSSGEHILSYGLSFVLLLLIAWALLRGVEPFSPTGEEVPVSILVSLFEGVVPCCLGLIVGLAAEYYGERELWQVAKGRQMHLTTSEDGLV